MKPWRPNNNTAGRVRVIGSKFCGPSQSAQLPEIPVSLHGEEAVHVTQPQKLRLPQSQNVGESDRRPCLLCQQRWRGGECWIWHEHV
ncbi:hypothetical protein RRG08_056197 [Elysia crispata]|uniref:Uncharacterized protein n=1 Tax=Elysia crispata TaxID=231223 RepID=A0AAE0YKJ7_9GAST|nr:hypothetical protein RRG08_056197 [Elysia crispata]